MSCMNFCLCFCLKSISDPFGVNGVSVRTTVGNGGNLFNDIIRQ